MQPTEDGELPFLLKQVLGAAIELQHADFGNIQLYDAENGVLLLITVEK